jgi:hypothetical protein
MAIRIAMGIPLVVNTRPAIDILFYLCFYYMRAVNRRDVFRRSSERIARAEA